MFHVEHNERGGGGVIKRRGSLHAFYVLYELEVYLFCIFAQESLRPTVLLNIKLVGVDSLSTQK